MIMNEKYGTLFVCATPIGNLSDISERFVKTLSEADLVAAEDTRHTLKLLNHLEIKKPMISYYEHNKRERSEVIIAKLKEGLNVVLVSDAGTPAISDPGEDLVALCHDEGIKAVAIPGCCAAVSALSVSGLPTGRFCFEGFLTVNRQGRRERLEEIKEEQRTMIFYEAPHKLLTTLKDMYSVFGERRISLCRELTKIHEETVRTTFSEAIEFYGENVPKGEFVVIVEGAEKAEEVFEETVAEHLIRLISSGTDKKEAIKTVARERGIPKKEVYAETLKEDFPCGV